MIAQERHLGNKPSMEVILNCEKKNNGHHDGETWRPTATLRRMASPKRDASRTQELLQKTYDKYYVSDYGTTLGEQQKTAASLLLDDLDAPER
ncbi:hypothetical protein PHYSODRAFT_330156 [Phytophthora sojae]|uniref:Uncharacterized protein n=1 Tax=Phytophthora sojae (strain P6497) TaxID=1094619 RepID=G4Z5M5_PHYSP|nr:hypothetical protein PHYSODRAFT_330156 [Phytophthora sojae]EGZ22339.1 hypothetical protein PHYSODRAFT_330156 [Phytophthora sojae]|eukprot:XP_009525056.1 hypothetical protein PHYSODRAFT_330156 [Phytophthora sojae]